MQYGALPASDNKLQSCEEDVMFVILVWHLHVAAPSRMKEQNSELVNVPKLCLGVVIQVHY